MAYLPRESMPPRVWTDDVPPERLQGVLAENGERIALLSDEGGIFEIMAGLYNNGRVNLNIFLQGHAGSEARAERQGRIVRLANPCLTFGLAVQPEVISDLARGDKKRFRGNGTLARFLYCIPQSTIGNRDVTRRATIPGTLKATYQAEITRLLDIEPVYDEQGTERARILAFDTEARQTWLQFSQFIESNMGNNGELRSIQDWASKLPGAVARIAGLLHVAKHGPTSPSIDNSTITAAIDLATNLVNHALAAFDLMGSDQSTNDAKTVFRWILEKRLEHFRQRDCQRAFRTLDPKRMEQAEKVLYDRHIISEPIKRGGGSTGGRPSIMYTVNPAIFDFQV
ncbi:MAG: DUF3987 domain-containing protein [Deltaproteobacteria bacterium]|nr:DUF3987 domain-containing protein [Deltaproteobacteria bacterium]